MFNQKLKDKVTGINLLIKGTRLRVTNENLTESLYKICVDNGYAHCFEVDSKKKTLKESNTVFQSQAVTSPLQEVKSEENELKVDSQEVVLRPKRGRKPNKKKD